MRPGTGDLDWCQQTAECFVPLTGFFEQYTWHNSTKVKKKYQHSQNANLQTICINVFVKGTAQDQKMKKRHYQQKNCFHFYPGQNVLLAHTLVTQQAH